MKLKPTLPQRIQCPSLDVAVAVATFIADADPKRKLDNNIRPALFTSLDVLGEGNGRVMLGVSEDSITRQADNSTLPLTVTSLRDFIERFCEQPIMIDHHVVAFGPTGIKVGCTSVTYSTIDRIMRERAVRFPETRGQQEAGNDSCPTR